MTLHAGQVIGLSRERVESFYAQTWAFAMFLREGEGGTNRPALQRWLSDAALNKGYFADVQPQAPGDWSPAQIKAMLEYYLRAPLADIERRYGLYLRHLADRYGRE